MTAVIWCLFNLSWVEACQPYVFDVFIQRLQTFFKAYHVYLRFNVFYNSSLNVFYICGTYNGAVSSLICWRRLTDVVNIQTCLLDLLFADAAAAAAGGGTMMLMCWRSPRAADADDVNDSARVCVIVTEWRRRREQVHRLFARCGDRVAEYSPGRERRQQYTSVTGPRTFVLYVQCSDTARMRFRAKPRPTLSR